MKAKLWLLLAVSCTAVGCSNRPARIEAPAWNPTAISTQLIAEFDSNGDGVLDKQELASVPSVSSSLARIDSDADGQLSQAELAARFQLYKDLRVGVKRQPIQVIYRRQPLANAVVRLVPESFQGDIVAAAEGTTDSEGLVFPSTVGKEMDGVQLGFYRVEISSEDVVLPARFSSNTELGLEVSPISEGVDGYGPILLELK